MAANKKEAIKEYKARATPRGIYAVRCAATGEVWVGAAPNLDTIQNRLWFMLRYGNHRNERMQAAWAAHGEASFAWEVVERLDDDVPAIMLSDVLKREQRRWMARLGAAAV